MHDNHAPRYTCCICQLEAVTDRQHTCGDCRELFTVNEDQDAKAAAAQRKQIGPTDI